jgi:hypothetical protein
MTQCPLIEKVCHSIFERISKFFHLFKLDFRYFYSFMVKWVQYDKIWSYPN